MHLQRVEAPDVDDLLIRRLAEQVARATHQGISREPPLLGATLPDGALGCSSCPPGDPPRLAMAFRRHRLVDLPLSAYAAGPITSGPEVPPIDPLRDPFGFLRRAIAERRTILVSGGTSSGKTTFLNALLREVPPPERMILIEDTPELRLASPSGLGLVAAKVNCAKQGWARRPPAGLAPTATGPDRAWRAAGGEAVSFLRAINTGYPGSFSTSTPTIRPPRWSS